MSEDVTLKRSAVFYTETQVAPAFFFFFGVEWGWGFKRDLTEGVTGKLIQ